MAKNRNDNEGTDNTTTATETETQTTATQTAEPVHSSPQVLSGPCPRNGSHRSTRVYKTSGRKRYCKCNDCGETWTMVGDFADPLRQFCHELAESLEQSPRDTVEGETVIVMDDATAKSITQQLRTLSAG